jgi:hypothetical protein
VIRSKPPLKAFSGDNLDRPSNSRHFVEVLDETAVMMAVASLVPPCRQRSGQAGSMPTNLSASLLPRCRSTTWASAIGHPRAANLTRQHPAGAYRCLG